MDVQAVIVPGVGVAACQAGVDNTRENQMLVYNELKKGTPPAQILEMLKKDPNVERRQFGILAMPNGGTITARNNRAGFNGSGNSRVVALLRRAGRRHLLPGAGQHAARRPGGAPGRAGLHARDRHAGRSRDGGHGSRRRQRRRPSLQLRQQPARLRAVRQQDRARRLHRDRRQGRSGRRDAQRRQVLRLHQRDRRQHEEGRERQPGQDAADALRRVEEVRFAATPAAWPDPYKPAATQ